jgi:ribosome maturation factor RimP
MELIDIEYRRESRGWVIRFYIDKEGELTLTHCSHLSKEIGDLLEVKDLIPHNYILEVSSPGLNRPLKKENDFITYVGETIKVKTFKPIDQRKRFQGTLLGYKEGKVMLSSDNQEVHIPFPLIAKANIQYQFPDSKKKKTNIKKS